jgi:CheY-like chemotaxis protein
LAPKLLVVDDDPAVRESFARLLRHYGYAVKESSTGRAALQRLRAIHSISLSSIGGSRI